ncbi:NAD(P)-dependent dehydrogenase, short-chain alcohol dehydrogenase family [Clostridium amylolyticum]|uniref:NAD(P)-dependent dehydrogenase, short-chain alcohol dehydrogenase family n=1 Tax=Clostridium amylolyticum TaxID=1121298 RepID=A0A1M6N129_9CLOT|nr:SDR family NAD(P)-dependent oxidoreductase [Clostridium amylolyticum]SHJ89409.1 NAD(P)-dependent dehydrogenase, short-chain alcohol dehydrogenase family [Clostridium amylolyticum]
MNDKIVIVTGANSGIGREAAIRFAEEGYTVIMACRNLEKSKKVQQEIIELTKNNGVDLLKLDVSSFMSIEDFCSEFKEKYKKLDILIHNAGYFNHGEKNYQLSPDNIELSFATNAFCPFLMTKLLTDMLKKSEDARVLNACTTNIRHFFDPKRKIDFDNLQGEFMDSRPYNIYKMYGDSKMALLMLTFKMGDIFKKDGIQVNAVQIPAIKMSKETMEKFKSVWRIAAMVQNIHSSSPETMADTYFHICTSEEFKDITGKLINDKREIMQSSHYTRGLMQEVKQLFDKGVYPKYADNIENIERVWDLAVKLTKSMMKI